MDVEGLGPTTDFQNERTPVATRAKMVEAMRRAVIANNDALSRYAVEVSAVEDPALREVALGGPDTAARTRLIQRVQRIPVDSADCEIAFAAVLERVYSAAAAFDRTAMRLESRMRLRVDFVPEPDAAD